MIMNGFLERLRKYKDDRGMMADLRCFLVDSKRHRAWPALYRLGIPIDDEVRSFVAGLFATHPEVTSDGNFGKTCRQIQQRRGEVPKDKEPPTPTERRFLYLLAAERSEIQSRVKRMVLMAKSHDVPVNYEQLATDLKFWNERTKRAWASSFWTSYGESRKEEESS
jgi:CRISPR system Cascade subunit CasB